MCFAATFKKEFKFKANESHFFFILNQSDYHQVNGCSVKSEVAVCAYLF